MIPLSCAPTSSYLDCLCLASANGPPRSSDPSAMASGPASSGRGASQPGTTSKAAPPRAASSCGLGASAHSPGAPQPGTAPTGASFVEFSVGSFNFGMDQLMLQGRPVSSI